MDIGKVLRVIIFGAIGVVSMLYPDAPWQILLIISTYVFLEEVYRRLDMLLEMTVHSLSVSASIGHFLTVATEDDLAETLKKFREEMCRD